MGCSPMTNIHSQEQIHKIDNIDLRLICSIDNFDSKCISFSYLDSIRKNNVYIAMFCYNSISHDIFILYSNFLGKGEENTKPKKKKLVLKKKRVTDSKSIHTYSSDSNSLLRTISGDITKASTSVSSTLHQTTNNDIELINASPFLKIRSISLYAKEYVNGIYIKYELPHGQYVENLHSSENKSDFYDEQSLDLQDDESINHVT